MDIESWILKNCRFATMADDRAEWDAFSDRITKLGFRPKDRGRSCMALVLEMDGWNIFIATSTGCQLPKLDDMILVGTDIPEDSWRKKSGKEEHLRGLPAHSRRFFQSPSAAMTFVEELIGGKHSDGVEYLPGRAPGSVPVNLIPPPRIWTDEDIAGALEELAE